MSTLIFVKGLVGLVVLLSAIGALLTQLQIRRKIQPIIKARTATLLNWHRWLGRTALAAFVLNSVICIQLGFYPVLFVDTRHIIHSVISVVAAVAFVGKVWATRFKVRWGLQRILLWGIALFALQIGIFLSATGFVLWTRIAAVII